MDALAAYGSDDDGDTDEPASSPVNGDDASKRKRPRDGEEDGRNDNAAPASTSGRVRAFPHVQGNFATHVYVPLAVSDWTEARHELGDLLAKLARAVPTLRPIGTINANLGEDCDSAGGAAAPSASNAIASLVPDGDLHVSLSHTFPIRAARKAGLLTALRRGLARDLAAGWDALVGPNLEVFVNDARTTTFLALRVGTASPIDPSPGTSPGTAANASGSWKGAYSAVNGVMRERGYPQFYEDPETAREFRLDAGGQRGGAPGGDRRFRVKKCVDGAGHAGGGEGVGATGGDGVGASYGKAAPARRVVGGGIGGITLT